MDGKDVNVFMSYIIEGIKATAPSLIHKCPYAGVIEFKNITYDDESAKKVSLFPDGQYKYNVTIGDKADTIRLVLVIFTELKSPLKSSFG